MEASFGWKKKLVPVYDLLCVVSLIFLTILN
jgi:hypothetical protein